MKKCSKFATYSLGGEKTLPVHGYLHLSFVLFAQASGYVQISSCHYYKHGHYLEEVKRFMMQTPEIIFRYTSALHLQTCQPGRRNKNKIQQTIFFSQNGMFYILDIVLLPIAFLMSLIQSVKCCSNTYLTLVNLNINRWLLFHIDEHKTISIYLYRK